MGIGLSTGIYFQDEMEWMQHVYKNTDKNMNMTPDDFLGNKGISADPNNITDDQGNIVDYSTPEQLNELINPVITP